jgi:hypothetical protein
VVSVVTTVSLRDTELCVLLNQDEEVGDGFDELDELTRAYAVTIHRSQAARTLRGRPLVTSAWPILQRTWSTRHDPGHVERGAGRQTASAERRFAARRRPSLHRPHRALTEGWVRIVAVVGRPQKASCRRSGRVSAAGCCSRIRPGRTVKTSQAARLLHYP